MDTSNSANMYTFDSANVDTLLDLKDLKSTNKNASEKSNVDSSKVNKEDTSRKRNSKKRLTKEELERLILKYCEYEYKSMDEIAKDIQKDVKYLKNKIIPAMIEQNILVRLFPSTKNHPQQKYKKHD